MSQALEQSDGLAVVAVFVVIGASGRAMRALEPAMRQIEHENDVVRLDSIRLINLLPDNANAFYRYNGSLTSPGCQETVIWTVLTDPISVTEQQMTDLRRMRDAHDQVLDHNNRPPQNLNGRRIFSSSTSNLPPSNAVYPYATFTLSFILFALVLL